MAKLDDSGVRELLTKPNHAVISTLNKDGTVHNTVVWISDEDGAVAVNSAIGRQWPTNLERDPRVTVLVAEEGDPHHYVEIRGTATASTEGADAHINALSKKYIDQDEYPYRQEGEERIKFRIKPDRVRYVKQS
jgi:PPOX class probable F420-dependent enzyme